MSFLKIETKNIKKAPIDYRLYVDQLMKHWKESINF